MQGANLGDLEIFECNISQASAAVRGNIFLLSLVPSSLSLMCCPPVCFGDATTIWTFQPQILFTDLTASLPVPLSIPYDLGSRVCCLALGGVTSSYALDNTTPMLNSQPPPLLNCVMRRAVFT
jgi:hypothetical protein